MNKWACVDFSICRPALCDGKTGACSASLACRKNLLEQEEPFDSPVLLSSRMCVGCGDCVTACPFGAVRIESGL
jgi:Fe-S-cluster-containing hydrogenase component 2